jgi:hypothetical protein
VLVSSGVSGNGGDVQIPIGVIDADTITVVRAHKEHGATPANATDIQITLPAALLARPGPAPTLALTRIDDTTIALSGGEPGVLYYLRDPETNELLGNPAYFHRHDEADTLLNRGLGQLRVGRDFAVALGPIAEGDDRSTTDPRDPVVVVSAIPADNLVNVMAIRARTGVAWSAPKTMVVVIETSS